MTSMGRMMGAGRLLTLPTLQACSSAWESSSGSGCISNSAAFTFATWNADSAHTTTCSSGAACSRKA